MRAALLAPLLVACIGTPDRWSVSGSQGRGELEGFKADRDFEDKRLEVGISGPLFPQKEPNRRLPPLPLDVPTPTRPAPDESSLPWLEIALILGGAAGGKASEYGYKKIKRKA